MTEPSDAIKHRELIFSSQPSGQAERACMLLRGLDGLEADLGTHANSLCVSYNLHDYSLERLVHALMVEGFCFDDNSLQQISKKLIYYREKVELHNLNITHRPAKERERAIFVKAYEHHPHGDHDDTPQELREYK